MGRTCFTYNSSTEEPQDERRMGRTCFTYNSSTEEPQDDDVQTENVGALMAFNYNDT